MVVVVDSDLRADEWEIIRSLSILGKRLLLVLNKCDLRGEQEEKNTIRTKEPNKFTNLCVMNLGI